MANVATSLYLAMLCTLALQTEAFAQQAQVSSAPTPTETGTLGQAPYRIDFPPNWNGELVVLAHGFEPVGVPRTSPMAANEATPIFLSRGYAVAQSDYSTQGWAVREAITDIETLRRHFVQKHGVARRTYLVGFSMGGGIAVSSLEQHGKDYDGALSLCGANVPGARLTQELFTTLVAFDYFFPDAPGMAGGLAMPQADAAKQGQIMSAIAGALAGKPAVAAQLAQAAEVPVEALPGVVSLHYLVFQDIARRAGGMPVDNRKTVYSGFGDDRAFNAGVRRYAGDAKAMQYAASAPSITGRTDKPLVIQYNHADPTITPRFQSVFAELSGKAGKAKPLTLPPVGEGHCGFSQEQVAQALQTLVDQIGSAAPPRTR